MLDPGQPLPCRGHIPGASVATQPLVHLGCHPGGSTSDGDDGDDTHDDGDDDHHDDDTPHDAHDHSDVSLSI